MRHSTLAELAEESGIRLPPALADGEALRVPASQRGWFRFQRLYDSARSVVRSEAAMRRIVREAAEDDAAEGSRRLEIQVDPTRSEEHTSELQSRGHLVCRLLLEKK